MHPPHHWCHRFASCSKIAASFGRRQIAAISCRRTRCEAPSWGLLRCTRHSLLLYLPGCCTFGSSCFRCTSCFSRNGVYGEFRGCFEIFYQNFFHCFHSNTSLIGLLLISRPSQDLPSWWTLSSGTFGASLLLLSCSIFSYLGFWESLHDWSSWHLCLTNSSIRTVCHPNSWYLQVSTCWRAKSMIYASYCPRSNFGAKMETDHSLVSTPTPPCQTLGITHFHSIFLDQFWYRILVSFLVPFSLVEKWKANLRLDFAKIDY